ncbi:MAG: HlyD family secretion protein [Anaerolineae bacterium]
MRIRRILPIILVLAAVTAALVFRDQLFGLGRQAWSAAAALLAPLRSRQATAVGALVASGMVEARTVDIASPSGGRIVALHVAEGQTVAAGELIAELDTSLLEAQIAEAQAAVEVAQAQLALLQAGAREADLAVARAAVGQAEAARDAAYTAWQDALALIDAPAELDVQIAQAAAALQAAAEQVRAAEAAATAADLEVQLWGRIVKSLEAGIEVPLPIPGGGTTRIEAPPERLAYASLQWNLASQRAWQAHARHTAAVVARDAARQTLNDLQAQRAEPLALRGQAEVAARRYRLAVEAVAVAQAEVAVLEAGATPEQIAAAEAVVAQAQAAVATLAARKAQARIVAPQAGTVTAVVLRQGEVAAPAAAIARVADLSAVTLTVYVPEPRLGEVTLGQSVAIAVDSFPGRTFPGTVTYIAGRAEFTPKNIQTREERATTVFAVKISAANPDAVLKPGMPADVYFDGPNADGQGNGRWDRLRQTPLWEALTASRVGQPAVPFYSGVIEATEVRVAAETGGRVAEVYAEEGQKVTAGQVLAELDGEELAARRSQAQAALAAAQAELARVTAPPQPARIAQAQAVVSQAEAALAVAQAGLRAAQDLRAQPQALDAQINAARGQLRVAVAAVDIARAGLKEAQVLQESLPNPGSDEDRTRRAIYDQNVIAAEATVRAAQAQERGARTALAQLLAMREKPVALDAAVHRAEGEVAQAQAALNAARAALAQAQAPARPEAVAVARARVAQAKAALATLDAMAARLNVASPLAGTLTVQSIRRGEVVQPGVPLFTVTDLRRVTLVIYVPTAEIGRVALGAVAEVTVDAYPGRVFIGRVVHIADQAEFTPKDVQTQEERAKTVFAVKIELENEAGLLRPGMPADVTLK